MTESPPPPHPTAQQPAAEQSAAESPAATSLPDLLVKAVRLLPAAEQDGVLRLLLDRHTATWPPPPGVRGPWLPALTEADLGAGLGPGLGLSRTGERGSGTLRVVPVRLSAEQHEELKQWCEANDFSMAVVIRGLVDRFLSTQRRPR